jgi:thymidine phosphorylase
VKLDEAKRALELLRGSKERVDFMDEALGIALWLIEREQQATLSENVAPDDVAMQEAMSKFIEWLNANHKPFSL